jgi:RNAse (barnase) inhibitor barstar
MEGESDVVEALLLAESFAKLKRLVGGTGLLPNLGAVREPKDLNLAVPVPLHVDVLSHVVRRYLQRHYPPSAQVPLWNGGREETLRVAEVALDGSTIATPEDFYRQFFAGVLGIVPDYGGRNLDALNDDLRDLTEPLSIVWIGSTAAREALGEWFDRCIRVLREREPGNQPVDLILR